MRFTGCDATDTGCKTNDLRWGNPAGSAAITKLAPVIIAQHLTPPLTKAQAWTAWHCSRLWFSRLMIECKRL
jgi:hypothetical protein